MATFTPSAVISEIRGRVGTSIWSKNSYGVYVKNSYAPTNPNTIDQQNVRNAFATARANWATIPPEFRLQIEQQSKQYPVQDRLGNTVIRSGLQFWISRHMIARSLGNNSFFNNEPKQQMPTINPIITVSVSGGVIVQQNYEFTGGDFATAIYASAPMAATINSPNRSLINHLLGRLSTLSDPVNITTTYTAKYGSLAGTAGMKVFFYIASGDRNRGFMHPKLFIPVTITA